MDLLEIRGRLDQIDTQIEKLFEERMRLCSEVAEYKIATGKAVYDAEREKQKIESVQAMAESEFNKQAVAELFLQMMTLSRRYQYQTIAGRVGGPDLGFHKVEKLETAGKRVVFQGLEGAYGHAAALQFFGKDADIHHVRRFEDMMVEIQEGKADFAVLPIENSSAGAVTDNYDLLLKYDNVIVAETFLPVHHYLLGTPDAELSDVKRVFAHPQALMQCSQYLNARKDWQQISVSNTAAAAKKVLKEQDHSQAAVCSAYAAQVYGLSVLAEDINDETNNVTRFIIVTNQKIFTPDASKISICFELPHQSGSLYQILSHFIYNDLNMTKIESRPVEGKSWEYRFFVDFEGNLEQPGVKNAIRGLREEARNLKILGNY